MSLREHKMQGIFHRQSPPLLTSGTGEDALEFLMTCQEQLHSLGLLKLRESEFIAR